MLDRSLMIYPYVYSSPLRCLYLIYDEYTMLFDPLIHLMTEIRARWYHVPQEIHASENR